MTIKWIHKQRGVASVEFVYIVVAIMVIVFGLVSIYRLMYTQTRLDTTAYTIAEVVSRTFDDKELAPSQPLKDLVDNQFDAADLRTLTKRMLPAGIAIESIGIAIQIRRQIPASVKSGLDKFETDFTLRAGTSCEFSSTIDQLAALAPKSQRTEVSLNGRVATLVQAKVCIENPFSLESQFALTGFVLPTRLSSEAVMVGGRYAR